MSKPGPWNLEPYKCPHGSDNEEEQMQDRISCSDIFLSTIRHSNSYD